MGFELQTVIRVKVDDRIQSQHEYCVEDDGLGCARAFVCCAPVLIAVYSVIGWGVWRLAGGGLSFLGSSF